MIIGEKVVIQGITKESAHQIYRWVNSEELRSLTGTVYPVSEYEHEKWIECQATASDRKLFIVSDKESKECIGTIGLKNFDWINRNVELYVSLGGLFTSEKVCGGGYGTDAVSTLIKYCFRNLNMHKVYLHVFESNKRAIRCYEKAGMKTEGVLIDHHFQNGEFENTLVMGIENSS